MKFNNKYGIHSNYVLRDGKGNTTIAFHLVVQETNFKQCISDAVHGTPSSLEI